jgi:hypothetical protein
MTKAVDSARRRFIRNAGAALSAPLAAVAATASAGTASADHASLAARLAMLEDTNAIRELMRSYVKHANARAHAQLAKLCANPGATQLDGIGTLTADAHGADDAIEIGADGRTATARLRYMAETERPIEPTCPLVEMARVQGGGVTRHAERGVLDSAFVKLDGVWKVGRVAFRPT